MWKVTHWKSVNTRAFQGTYSQNADSSDVDRGYRVKAISVPAIPIRVGAQRRWRDSVSREVIEIVKLGELSSERSEAILMWSWEGGVGEGAGV
jgi:hypothetical protein